MTTTLCVDANRSISKFKDTNKLRWINTLEPPLLLKKGDVISLQGSHINQRGSNVETINFNNDVNEEIIFTYYIIDNDIPFAGDDHTITRMYRDGLARPTGMETTKVGWTHTPYFYYGSDHEDLRPHQGSQKINIPAGSYSPNNIGVMLSEMFAGRYVEGKTYEDYINDDGLRFNSNTYGLCSTNNEFMITITPNNETPSDVSTDCPMFLQQKTSKEINELLLLDGNAVNKASMISKNHHWITTQSHNALNPHFHDYVNQYQFLGCVPTITWDASKSRFELNYLHAPYRLANYKTPTDDKAQENRGEEAVEFYRNPVVGIYSRSAFGGCCITNPAWSYVSQNTQIGKDILDKLNNGSDNEKRQASIKKTTYKFNQYFNNNSDALEGWKNTIWHRLGFSMKQFTDDSKWLKYYNINDIEEEDGVYSIKSDVEDETPMMGISTTQQITTDMAMNSGGLAETHHGSDDKGIYNQGYSYETAGYIPHSDANVGGTVVLPDKYTMLSQALALTASNLPKLTEQPYYNIWTDLLDSSSWYTNEGNQNSLIGQVSKNYSAGDYIYGFDANINFTLTKDKTVNQITTEILNADNTSPNPILFDDSCSVLYKIVRYQQQK